MLMGDIILCLELDLSGRTDMLESLFLRACALSCIGRFYGLGNLVLRYLICISVSHL